MISFADVIAEVVEQLRNYINPENNKPAPLISEEVFEIVMKNADVRE